MLGASTEGEVPVGEEVLCNHRPSDEGLLLYVPPQLLLSSLSRQDGWRLHFHSPGHPHRRRDLIRSSYQEILRHRHAVQQPQPRVKPPIHHAVKSLGEAGEERMMTDGGEGWSDRQVVHAGRLGRRRRSVLGEVVSRKLVPIDAGAGEDGQVGNGHVVEHPLGVRNYGCRVTVPPEGPAGELCCAETPEEAVDEQVFHGLHRHIRLLEVLAVDPEVEPLGQEPVLHYPGRSLVLLRHLHLRLPLAAALRILVLLSSKRLDDQPRRELVERRFKYAPPDFLAPLGRSGTGEEGHVERGCLVVTGQGMEGCEPDPL
mmetsp:Transcript_35288/g.110277  ORF Transcript_35288/g.110277 Transcript_35288/m.110277 type:complete len:314 (-) Transcript_35288:290-1231(-)